jgi:hypothetical protein
VKVKVEGAAAKIEALFRFDKTLWRAMQRDIREVSETVAADARNRVPTQGLYGRSGTSSGWGRWISGTRDLSFDQGSVRGGIKARSRSRSKGGGFREVVGRVDMMSPAGAIFALVGSQNKSGHPFNALVNRQHGGSTTMRRNQFWPRMLTPARYAKGGEAAEKIGRIVERGVNDINRA